MQTLGRQQNHRNKPARIDKKTLLPVICKLWVMDPFLPAGRMPAAETSAALKGPLG